ncbi:MAG: ATP cone domain-containing protein [Candidatus Nanohaloarchaeota archaeon QJJ-9]|nr:ATP cone domain-containing protein [Candidatus Nanohaloarchaeota archaeon QJJ-9]
MALVVKREGRTEKFDKKKLYASIHHPAVEAGYKKQQAEQIAEKISEKIEKWARAKNKDCITSEKIREKAEKILGEKYPQVEDCYKNPE